MPPQRGGGDNVTAYGSEDYGHYSPEGEPEREPRGLNGGSGGAEITDYYHRRDEFDSFEPILLRINHGNSGGPSADLVSYIFINSYSESVEKEGEHEEVDSEILDIKWELEVDPDLDNIDLPENLTVELLTKRTGLNVEKGEGDNLESYEFTHIFKVCINDIYDGNVFLDFINNYLWNIKLLGNYYYTKQDTFKYYRDTKYLSAPLNSIRKYLRFWVKLTQEESNKSIHIPIYFNIPEGPTPPTPVG